MSFHPNHATTCDHCGLAGPDRVGLTVGRADQPYPSEHGFCGIGCLIAFVQQHYLVRALASSPSPGRRSAVDGRGGDDGGAQAQPLGEVELEQVPPTSEAGS